MKRPSCLLFPLLLAALSLHAQIELLGPGALQTSRNQQIERADGTGSFLELVITPIPGNPGFSTADVWTSKRDAGKYTRTRLNSQQLAIGDVVRIAREYYDFPFTNFSAGNAALAENRIAILSGTTDFSVRLFNFTTFALGRAVSVPALARTVAIRPGADEAWTLHSSAVGQIAIIDTRNERLANNIQLNLPAQSIPLGLWFSNSGRTAYVLVRNPDSQTSDRGQIQVFDAVTRQRRAAVTLGTTIPSGGLLSPDGSTLHVFGTSPNETGAPQPSLTYFDTFSASASGAAFIAATPDQYTIHPAGLRLYWTQASTSTVEEFDVQARAVVRRYSFPRTSIPTTIDITPTGDVLSVRDSAGQQSLHIDSGTFEVLDTQPLNSSVSLMLVRP